MSTLFVHTVGICRIDLDGRVINPSSPLVRATLLMLATHPRRRVSVDAVARTLWQDRPPAAPASRVSGYIGEIRRLLGPDGAPLLRTHRATGGGACSYSLHLTDDQVDMTRLRTVTASARARAAAGDITGAMAILERWLTGYPLEDDALPHTTGLTTIRRRIELLVGDAIALYAGWCLESRHFDGIERHVVPYLMRCRHQQLQAVWAETVRVYYAHSLPDLAGHSCCVHPASTASSRH